MLELKALIAMIRSLGRRLFGNYSGFLMETFDEKCPFTVWTYPEMFVASITALLSGTVSLQCPFTRPSLGTTPCRSLWSSFIKNPLSFGRSQETF